jgi:hypothetical protein
MIVIYVMVLAICVLSLILLVWLMYKYCTDANRLRRYEFEVAVDAAEVVNVFGARDVQLPEAQHRGLRVEPSHTMMPGSSNDAPKEEKQYTYKHLQKMGRHTFTGNHGKERVLPKLKVPPSCTFHTVSSLSGAGAAAALSWKAPAVCARALESRGPTPMICSATATAPSVMRCFLFTVSPA